MASGGAEWRGLREIRLAEPFSRSWVQPTGLISPPAERTGAAGGGVLAQSFYAALRADTFARMPKPRIYVDTTIPSAYHTARTDAGMLERRDQTRRWWELAASTCELVISPAVLRELAQGRSDQVSLRLALVRGLPLLVGDDEVDQTVAMYIQHRIMPRDPEGDAMHLALASHYECEALVTWNFHHLANPNKLHRIRRLNEEVGLSVPRILSPLALMEEHS
jgi:predicted nucleic acid-binding protein